MEESKICKNWQCKCAPSYLWVSPENYFYILPLGSTYLQLGYLACHEVGVSDCTRKKKPESPIASNWPLYFESWNHKLSVLKGPLQAIFWVSWTYKACMSILVFTSSSLLASAYVRPVTGHSHILQAGNSLLTAVPWELHMQLYSLYVLVNSSMKSFIFF